MQDDIIHFERLYDTDEAFTPCFHI